MNFVATIERSLNINVGKFIYRLVTGHLTMRQINRTKKNLDKTKVNYIHVCAKMRSYLFTNEIYLHITEFVIHLYAIYIYINVCEGS